MLYGVIIMKDTGGIIRFCVCAVCCAATLIYNTYGHIFISSSENLPISNISIETPKSSNYTVLSGVSIMGNEENTQTTATEPNTPSAQSEIVAVSGSGEVKGEIIEKFISPYTAKDSYNNVYLKNSTNLTVDIKKLLDAKLGFKIEKTEAPQVLILHTHATETYMSDDAKYYTAEYTSRTQNEKSNMLAIGKIVADKLNASGIVTLHDKTLHDYPSYSESYSRAAKTINKYKSKYKDLKIVIDLHRDAIAANDTDKIKLTTQIDGKKAAQIMLVMGSQSGSVKNFPDWQENLKLALRLQQTLEVMYPSLARSLSLMPKNYNESLTTGSMLIEIGTDANTLEEAKYSAELLSDALVALLKTI